MRQGYVSLKGLPGVLRVSRVGGVGHGLRSRLGLAGIVFVVVAATGIASHTSNRPLEQLGGLTDEWFWLGTTIHIFGSLAAEGEHAIVFRPPGYPAFIAGTLALTSGGKA